MGIDHRFFVATIAAVTFCHPALAAPSLVDEPVVTAAAGLTPFEQITVVEESAYQLAANGDEAEENDEDEERVLRFPGQSEPGDAEHADNSGYGNVNLTANNWGISLGDSRGVNGLRINYRDSQLEWVNGINITAWVPPEESFPPSGDVTGLALGLPATAAENIDGLAASIAGTWASGRVRGISITGGALITGDDFQGVGVSGVGLINGGRTDGIVANGIGLVTDSDFRGIGVSGIGMVTDGDVLGVGISGIGVVGGGHMSGLNVGGIGTVSDGDINGLSAGGVGLVSGGDIKGVSVAGVGLVADDSITGIAVGGVGVVSDTRLTGVGIAGVGVVADEVRGGTASLMVSSNDYYGAAVTPLRFTIESGGNFRGLSVSAWNNIRGTNNGVTIGLLNYARHANGIQLGLINIVADNPPGLRVLPVFNRSF